MRAPLEWLTKYVALPADTTPAQVEEALIRLGHEVEGVHLVPPTVGALVVGQVLTIEELTEFKKPIRFCTVAVGAGNGPDGGDEPRGIICGARNFAVGDKVVIALPGTTLPGDFTIASRKTYGRLSDGMICSSRELGVGTDHDGIIVLDPDAEVGVDARAIVGADDVVLELSITPDRGYALSIRGLARELSAAFAAPFTDVAAGPQRAAGGPVWGVQVDDPEGCDRFVMARVTGVDPAAPSPYWMRRRLAAAGIRSISLAVDITNYVMVEYGQPLHAFDAAAVAGPLVVRRAVAGETVKTLDGVVRTLDPRDLVIADDSGVISLAGVMGGESTEIGSTTTDVLIEGAHWKPSVISRTARSHFLPSEASRRFERSVDPAVAVPAVEAAAALLVTYGGGQLHQGRTEIDTTQPSPVVPMPLSEPQRIIGRAFAAGVCAQRLEQIGCRVDPQVDDNGKVLFLVTPPTWRSDLTRAADLVEEIARLEGYDAIGSELPTAPAGRGLTSAQRRERQVAADLASAGLIENLSFPFIGPKDLDDLGLPADDIRRNTTNLLNPLDAERPSMRTTLLPGLLETVTRNLSRGVKDLGVFEIGLVFLPRHNAPGTPDPSVAERPSDAELAVVDASLPQQPQHVALVIAGEWERAGWWGPGRTAGWAEAIELARRIGRISGVELEVVADDTAPWHPGRCASLRVGGWPVGHAGELHPATLERMNLPARTVAVELNLSGFGDRVPPVPPALSSFPPALIDLALVVDESVTAAAVTAALRDGGGELLESVRLFDVYSGGQIESGRKSLAFSLVVRATDRTLTAAEATSVRDAAFDRAAAMCGASVRV